MHDSVPSQPGKSFNFSSQGKIREFEKNASNRRTVREFDCLKLEIIILEF